MLKNQEIIDKLTEDQKLRLVTDFAALSDDSIVSSGVACVRQTSLGEVNDKAGKYAYPSFFGMANSWDTELYGKIASDLAFRAGDDANFIYTPSVRLKSNVYAEGMSEDPYLSAAFAKAMCDGIAEAEATACLTDCSVRKIDEDALDKAVDTAALSDLLLKPFTAACKSGNAGAVQLTSETLKRGWRNVNTREVKKLLHEQLPQSVKTVFSGASQDTLVSSMPESGELVTATPVSALKAALDNYRRIKGDVERGSVSVAELNQAFSDGVAVSDEMLDEAVDKVISFAAKVSARRPLGRAERAYGAENPDASQAEYEAVRRAQSRRYEQKENGKFGDLEIFRNKLSLAASEESIVLLKNVGLLPLSPKARIAVVGELAESVKNLTDCIKLNCGESGAEYVGYEAGYKLSADRSEEMLGKAKALAANANTVIIVMGLGEEREAALAETKSLALPANQLALFDAVTDDDKDVIAVIVGDYLPDMKFDDYCGGVLTLPRGGERGAEALCNILFGKTCPSGRLSQSGYDDVDEYYKTLRDYKNAGRNKVGRFMGYRRYTSDGVGAKYPFGFGLSYARFEYSGLKADGTGVRFTLRNKSKVAGVETVQLYVSKADSSVVRPVRELKGFARVELQPKEKQTVSILLDPDDLAVYDTNDGKCKTESGKYTFCVGSSCADIRLRADVNIEGVEIAKNGDKPSDYLQSESNIVDGGYMLGGGRKKDKTASRVAPDFPYEKLFLDEFGGEEEEEIFSDSDGEFVYEDDKSVKYLGDGISARVLGERFAAYLPTCGLDADETAVRELISAMAASRLTFVCSDDKELFADYVNALGGFFGSTPVLQSAAGYASDEDLFVSGDGAGNETATPIYKLAAASAEYHESVHIIALDDVDPKALNGYFTPFVRYVGNPENDCITFGNYVTGEKSLTVAPNIWFVMRVSPSDAASIPPHIADISTLVPFSITRCPRESDAGAPPVNYYKLVNSFGKCEEKFELDENGWKHIDKLQSYVASRTGVRIGNKMWLQMEKYLSVYLAQGGEREKAIDEVVCCKLLPLFAPLLRGKLTKDDGDFSQTLESIFGEENVERSKAMANKLGLTAAL